MKYAREIGFGLVAVLLGAAVWMWLTAGTTGTGTVSDPASPAEVTARSAPEPAEEEVAAAAPSPEAVVRPPPGPRAPLSSIEVPPERIPRSTRPFSTPDEASAFVEDRVATLLSSIDPSLDVDHMERECTPDGRVCTFYGEWPGDDFVTRWMQAIGDGRTGLEVLEGVRFSTFKPIEEGGEKRMMLTAHAP
jgi:hypothetical protein